MNLVTENTDLKNRMQQVELKLEDVGKTVSEIRKTLDYERLRQKHPDQDSWHIIQFPFFY
jgi:hypothetical protein